MDDQLSPVLAALRTSRDAHLRLTKLLLLGSPIAAAAGAWVGGLPAAVAFGGLCLVFGVVSLLVALPHLRPERARLVVVLRERPQDIEAVHVRETDVEAAGAHLDTKFDVFVTLRGGERLRLGVFREALPGVLEALRAQAGLLEDPANQGALRRGDRPSA